VVRRNCLPGEQNSSFALDNEAAAFTTNTSVPDGIGDACANVDTSCSSGACFYCVSGGSGTN
jgi:hypothetical protein